MMVPERLVGVVLPRQLPERDLHLCETASAHETKQLLEAPTKSPRVQQDPQVGAERAEASSVVASRGRSSSS